MQLISYVKIMIYYRLKQYQCMRYQNYFELYNMNMNYGIDKKLLRKKYLELSQKHHPDRNDDKDTHIIMSDVISAYTILNDDFSRAKYIIGLMKIDISKNTDQDLVMKVFELNEKLDSLNQQSNLKEFHKQMNKEYEYVLSEFSKCYLHDTNKAVIALQYAKYYRQICKNIEDRLRSQ